MADKTGIEWADATWNPIVGCSIVSPGCTNCYAMQMAARIERMTDPTHHSIGASPRDTHYRGTTQPSKAGPVWTGKLALVPDHILTQPLRWKKPRAIFVNSMGDLFHEDTPDEWIDKVFAIMALAHWHTFLVLTKRAERMQRYLTAGRGLKWIDAMRPYAGWPEGQGGMLKTTNMALENVWLGVSTERQAEADERIPLLLATPAAKRFISAEPLLGAIDLRALKPDFGAPDEEHWRYNALSGGHYYRDDERFIISGDGPPLETLDWVIAGGESGKDARPMHPDWARGLRDQCAAAGVPFFFKQWGEWKEWRHDVDGPYVEEIGDEEAEAAAATIAREVQTPGWLTPSGHFYRSPEAFEAADGDEPGRVMERIGKRAAGRLLDGVEHSERPQP